MLFVSSGKKIFAAISKLLSSGENFTNIVPKYVRIHCRVYLNYDLTRMIDKSSKERIHYHRHAMLLYLNTDIVVGRSRFEPRPRKNIGVIIGGGCFLARPSTLRGQHQDWLARCQDNVTGWFARVLCLRHGASVLAALKTRVT